MPVLSLLLVGSAQGSEVDCSLVPELRQHDSLGLKAYALELRTGSMALNLQRPGSQPPGQCDSGLYEFRIKLGTRSVAYQLKIDRKFQSRDQPF